MNLKDRLKAIDKGSKPPRAQSVPSAFTDCWHRSTVRPVVEFPHLACIDRDTVMKMQGDEMPTAFDTSKILFLDTETTGLSGGAGTVAFEVGLGYLSSEGFVIHQYVMRDYPEEQFLLR